MKRMILSLMTMVCVLTLSAQRLRVGELSSGMSIYDFKVKDVKKATMAAAGAAVVSPVSAMLNTVTGNK